jgi:transcriptional regulator with XRE-family HTH domain
MSSDKRITATKIQRLLRVTGWTVKELASRVNGSPRSVERWKSGTPPSRVMEIALRKLYRRYVEESEEKPRPEACPQFIVGREEPCAIFVEGNYFQERFHSDIGFDDLSEYYEWEYMAYKNLSGRVQRELNKRLEGKTARIVRTHVFMEQHIEPDWQKEPDADMREYLEELEKGWQPFITKMKKDSRFEIKVAPTYTEALIQMVVDLLTYYIDPQACTTLVVVSDNPGLVPSLQAVRRQGRRVAPVWIVPYPRELFDFNYDSEGIWDYDPIELDNLMEVQVEDWDPIELANLMKVKVKVKVDVYWFSVNWTNPVFV